MHPDAGSLLVDEHLITEAQLQLALSRQVNFGGTLVVNLIELGLIEESALAFFLSAKLDLPQADSSQLKDLPSFITLLIPKKIVKNYCLVPFMLKDGVVQVAMTDPTDRHAVEEVEFATGYRVKPVVAIYSVVQNSIEHYYGTEDPSEVEALKVPPPPEAGQLAKPSTGSPQSTGNLFAKMSTGGLENPPPPKSQSTTSNTTAQSLFAKAPETKPGGFPVPAPTAPTSIPEPVVVPATLEPPVSPPIPEPIVMPPVPEPVVMPQVPEPPVSSMIPEPVVMPPVVAQPQATALQHQPPIDSKEQAKTILDRSVSVDKPESDMPSLVEDFFKTSGVAPEKSEPEPAKETKEEIEAFSPKLDPNYFKEEQSQPVQDPDPVEVEAYKPKLDPSMFRYSIVKKSDESLEDSEPQDQVEAYKPKLDPSYFEPQQEKSQPQVEPEQTPDGIIPPPPKEPPKAAPGKKGAKKLEIVSPPGHDLEKLFKGQNEEPQEKYIHLTQKKGENEKTHSVAGDIAAALITKTTVVTEYSEHTSSRASLEKALDPDAPEKFEELKPKKPKIEVITESITPVEQESDLPKQIPIEDVPQSEEQPSKATDLSDQVIKDIYTAEELIKNAKDRDEIAKVLIRFSLSFVNRASLFIVKKDMLVGWVGAGEGITSEQIKGIMVPLTSPSVFRTVRETETDYFGSLPRTTVNDIFISALGGKRPRQVLLVPITVKRKLIAIFFADCGTEIGFTNDLSPIHLFMNDVIKSLERIILQKKINRRLVR